MQSEKDGGAPYFSIVIPLYNREKEIPRAIDSCLGQGFGDFEVVVVDDASTDRSRAVVDAYGDRRIRLLWHERNRGVSPARNTGVDASQGDWILFLDSDDELLPDALSLIEARTRQAPEDIGRLFLMNQLDHGAVSPDPPLTEGIQDYAGFIRWCHGVRGPMDPFTATRREKFRTVRFPDSRATEALFHIDFARQFKTMTCPDFVNRVHSDADQRYSTATADSLLRQAPHDARALEELVSRHGTQLAETSPSYYCRVLAKTGAYCMMAGRRMAGLSYLARCLRTRPLSPGAWGALVLGLMGPNRLASAMADRRSRAVQARRLRDSDSDGTRT